MRKVNSEKKTGFLQLSLTTAGVSAYWMSTLLKPSLRQTATGTVTLKYSQADIQPVSLHTIFSCIASSQENEEKDCKSKTSSPSSMSSSALLCPSPMGRLPLITGLAGILGGSSVSPAVRREKQYDKTGWEWDPWWVEYISKTAL